MTELKMVGYPNFHVGSSRVAYIVDGDRVYFTGLDKHGTSTINAAETIVKAIASEEERSWVGLEFFDLQTHTGYTSRNPGQYEIDRLRVKARCDELVIDGWERVLSDTGSLGNPAEIPEYILDAFREHID